MLRRPLRRANRSTAAHPLAAPTSLLARARLVFRTSASASASTGRSGSRLRAVHESYSAGTLLPNGEHALGALLAGEVLIRLAVACECLFGNELLVVPLVANLGEKLWTPEEAVFHVHWRGVELRSFEVLPVPKVFYSAGIVLAGEIEVGSYIRLAMKVNFSFQLSKGVRVQSRNVTFRDFCWVAAVIG